MFVFISVRLVSLFFKKGIEEVVIEIICFGEILIKFIFLILKNFYEERYLYNILFFLNLFFLIFKFE